MIVSINPTYLCNFSCEFCYLTKEQLRDKSRANIESIASRLEEINKYEPIEMVDLYGGEVGLLGEDYLNKLDLVIREYTEDINVITNLYRHNEYFKRDDVYLSISWDYKAREKYQEVLTNIMMTGKPVSILMLASPEFIKYDPAEVMEGLSNLKNVESIEIKPYSQNQANDLFNGEHEFEECVKNWIRHFESNDNLPILENINRIKRTLSGEANAFSDSHVYIQPNSKLAVLEFDSKNREFFLELDSMEDYKNWSLIEKDRVNKNEVCSKCSYLGKCLTEHYREVKKEDKTCSGFRGLLDYYKEKENKRIKPLPVKSSFSLFLADYKASIRR